MPEPAHTRSPEAPLPGEVRVLGDERVCLRPHVIADIPRIVQQSNDVDSMRWTTVPSPYGPGEARDFLTLIAGAWADPRGHRFWAISAADDPRQRYLGTIDLRPRGGGLAAVGYGLHPEARGRGLMSAALRLVAQWWFTEQGGRRLTWSAGGGNLASWAVARAAGFTFDAIVPGAVALRTGEIVDDWRGSLDASSPARPQSPWFDPPLLHVEASGTTLTLRSWRADDEAAIEQPEHAAHWLPDRGVPAPGRFRPWLERRLLNQARGIAIGWCIANAETDRALGDVVLFVHEGSLQAGGEAEVGYWVSPSARGRGTATAAVGRAMAYAFAPEGLDLRRLVAVTAADNMASNAVLRGNGFTRWGTDPADEAPDGTVGASCHWHRER